MRKGLLTILSTLFAVTTVLAQSSILIPEIINYSKKTYESGTQNRAIGQDRRGLLYFANDNGLLVFDGTYWKTYPLPNGSIVRSLTVVDDRIYIGGQQEIGYFFFDGKGGLGYESLKHLIPPGETEFSDVWHVVHFRDDIFFRSNKRIFRFHKGRITAFKSINWGFLGVDRDLLIAQEYTKGLVVFKDTGWAPLATPYDFSKDKISLRSVSGFGAHKTFVTTLKSGIYIIDDTIVRKLETPSIAAIAKKIIHSACTIDTTQIIIATRLDGYYVINTRGEILQHVTKTEGLQSNTVNVAYADKEKNIWLGLNNGIDLVIYNSSIHHINPSQDNKSPGYSAALYNNQLYLGTGIGLYSIPFQPGNDLGGLRGNFNPVSNGNGLVWGLSVVNNQLLIGRNDGAFIVHNNTCIPLDTSTGFWFFQPLSAQQPCPRVIAGTYNGINVYNYIAGRFVNPKSHTSFESAKYTVVQGNDIWVAHPYQGLYKISFNDTGGPVNQPYADVHNLLSSGHTYLFKIHDKIVLVTRKGFYEYDKTLGDFKESVFLKKLFGTALVSYLREDTQGNIWFIENQKPGVIDLSSPDNPVKVYFSALNNSVLVNDEEFIYPINKNNILIAGETGFYHLDYEKYKETDLGLRVLLRTVTAFHKKDSALFEGYLADKDSAGKDDLFAVKEDIGFKWNSLHFEFSSPYFGGTVEYSCRLKGYEKEWSSWSKKTERSYTNLPAGNYIFEVGARNNTGHQSSISRFLFTISPPWYKTFAAYFMYVALVILLIYFFYKKQQRKYAIQHANRLKEQQDKFEEEQRRLQYLHQLEIEKNEKEIIRLKNIKLEAEVEHNEAELASNTMNLLQKRELLNKIQDEILEVLQETEADRRTKNIRRIIKIINEQLEISDDWERFSLYFDKANNDFLKILKENHPALTPTDLKLCAYLRLNLSTKAIADLLNLSIRGVESSRYRLRKKLELVGDISLFDFLGSIGSTYQSKSNGTLSDQH
ncbi:MAG TPA: triple tyrosine motif-containing protein [Puia sp.]|jgi:ligand-binding sensor domain-containing protein/DNA-binding CsgD family transcriptional regulator